MSTKLRFVCATRADPGEFARTALGKSLATYNYGMTEVRLFPNNTLGLPTLYNAAIRESAADPAILIFVHDDVYICDFFWPGAILGGLSKFDVVGIAGNRRRSPRQPGWYFSDKELRPDASEFLSGIVAHGRGFPPERLDFYGAVNQEVKLLDGLLIAVHSETLISHRLLFDERFDFHHYDLDFCRQAEKSNLRLGTIQLSVVHESRGGFASEAWWAGYEKYIAKWGS